MKAIYNVANNFSEKCEETINQNFVDEIYKTLNDLPLSEQIQYKSTLIKSILIRDFLLFTEVMKRLKKEDYKLILNNHFQEEKLDNILESSAIGFIQDILNKEDPNITLIILQAIFQSIPEISQKKGMICMEMKLKKKIAGVLFEKLDSSVKNQLTDLSYNDSLMAFSPLLGDKNYIKTKISKNNYLSIISQKNLTTMSEFIVLTVGFLQSQDQINYTLLQKISSNYLFVDYEACLQDISEYFKKEEKLESLSMAVDNCIENLNEDHLNHNNTRRFFETRLAQYINGLIHSKDTLENAIQYNEYSDSKLRNNTLDAVNKILRFFLGTEGTVNSPLEMEQKISIFAHSYTNESKFDKDDQKYFETVVNNCKVFQGHDRIRRSLDKNGQETGLVERKYETNLENVGKDIWNSAGGVMMSSSPTFLDSQYIPMRNMLVDCTKVEEKKDNKEQWFFTNNRKRAAYVGSISGHTCKIVAMLTKYMEVNKEDSFLSRDLTLFLIQLVGVYAKRGYHGMLEVMDVLHDSFMQKIFNKYDVNLNLVKYFNSDSESYSFLFYAMNDASTYAAVLIGKDNIKNSLKNHSFFKQENEKSEFNSIKNSDIKEVDSNKIKLN
jgi:hypothetical protein